MTYVQKFFMGLALLAALVITNAVYVNFAGSMATLADKWPK